MESRGLSASERALARVGTTVRGYRLQRLLGLGGMAAVYAAIDRDGHHVAIKFVLDRYVENGHRPRMANLVRDVSFSAKEPLLREGKSIDLQGAASSLDFDLATGEARTDFALTCAGWLELGVPKGGQEPGPIFRAATKSIEGLPLNCR